MTLVRFAISSVLVAVLSRGLTAATIFESASLGQTGLSYETILDQGISGLSVLPNVFAGHRFEVSHKTRVTRIGGHFVENSVDGGAGSIFGALLVLEDESDFPNSPDLSTPDVLATTLITLPILSDEVTGELPLTLEPGWYAVIYGSRLFGADGFGAAVSNGIDIGSPSYIGGQPTVPGFWWELPSLFTNQRFFVEGQVIPEPSSLGLLTSLLLLGSKRGFKKGVQKGDILTAVRHGICAYPF